MWKSFQEGFSGWTENHLKQLKGVARDLMIFLRRRGVYVESSKRPVAKMLFKTLQEEEPTEWSEYQLQKQKQTGDFLKPFNPEYAIFKPSENPVIKSTTLKNVEPNAPQNPFQIGIQSNIQDSSSSQRLGEKQKNIKHESGEKTIFQHEPPAPCPTEILMLQI